MHMNVLILPYQYQTHSIFTSSTKNMQSPVLLPTVSDEPRTDFAGVKDYFDAFILKKPQGKILDGKINIGDGWASDSGIYEVCLFIFLARSVHTK